MPVVTDFLGLAAYHVIGAQSVAKPGWPQCDFVKLSALGYEHNLSQPAIRLWDDTRHVEASQFFRPEMV